MTATLECTGLTKRYAGQDQFALGSPEAGVAFNVRKGELFALLGPSGCGKTTTLRIVGGFVRADAGSVRIDGRDITYAPPYARPTNTVFQSYALFPHLRIDANVAFGPRMARIPKEQRRRLVGEALEKVGLAGYERRHVSELSGGQQQRAALARAIVNQPAVLLLDEPLGALDLKLRREMQEQLVRLKGETNTTFVHVTHDQEEACAIADRIAIMDRGHIVQVDTPLALYRHPRTSYVARFIAAGTIIHGAAARSGDTIELQHPEVLVRGLAPAALNNVQDVASVLPPDRLRIRPRSEDFGENSLSGKVQRVVFTGSVFDVTVATPGGLEVHVAVTDVDRDETRPGVNVNVTWRPKDVIFVADTDGAAERSDDRARFTGGRETGKAAAPNARP